VGVTLKLDKSLPTSSLEFARLPLEMMAWARATLFFIPLDNFDGNHSLTS